MKTKTQTKQIVKKVNEQNMNQARTLTYMREGIEVRDSRHGLAVMVIPEDIAHAICKDHQRCVVARAIMRVTKALWVDVGAEIVLIGYHTRKCRRYRFGLPARRQVQYFDTHDGRFAPCTVQLLPPSHAKRLGMMSRGKVRATYNRGRLIKRRQPTR